MRRNLPCFINHPYLVHQPDFTAVERCPRSSGSRKLSQGQDDRAKATCGNQEANGAKPRNPWTDAQELTELAVEGNALLSHPSAISR